MAEKKPLDKQRITLNITAGILIVGFIFTTTWGVSTKVNSMESKIDFLIENDAKNTEDHKGFYKFQTDTNLTLLSIDMRLKSIEDDSKANLGLLLEIRNSLKEINNGK